LRFGTPGDSPTLLAAPLRRNWGNFTKTGTEIRNTLNIWQLSWGKLVSLHVPAQSAKHLVKAARQAVYQ
jgi:hypothetical protein